MCMQRSGAARAEERGNRRVGMLLMRTVSHAKNAHQRSCARSCIAARGCTAGSIDPRGSANIAYKGLSRRVMRSAFCPRMGPHGPTLPPQTASVVGVGVSSRDEKSLRALGPHHGHRASSVRAELIGCQVEKCLLLPGDDISPNKLTMPPVAIECVRNIRREALASFWEACHVAKHNVTKPDHL